MTHEITYAWRFWRRRSSQLHVTVVVKADEQARRAVLEQLRSIDRTQPIQMGSLDERFAQQTALARLFSSFFVAMGIFALVVAAVGVSGTIRQLASARRRELGIRMAVGASRPQIVVALTRGLFVPLAAGLGGGLVVAWWAASVLHGYLFATPALDPAPWLIAIAVLGASVAMAGLLPATGVLRWNVAEIMRGD